jgi:DNA-binding response OmpR family regulator
MHTRARHLLVVERDRRVGSYIAQALRAEGYQVDWATGDEEALACARRAPPELIVLDATRPDQGGVALARALREAQPDVPLLVVTADLADDDPRAELAQSRLVKPFRLDDLLAEVEGLLGR